MTKAKIEKLARSMKRHVKIDLLARELFEVTVACRRKVTRYNDGMTWDHLRVSDGDGRKIAWRGLARYVMRRFTRIKK